MHLHQSLAVLHTIKLAEVVIEYIDFIQAQVQLVGNIRYNMTIPRNLSFLADFISNTGSVPIASISEMQISNPANNELLVYDSAAGKWKNNSTGAAATPAAISSQTNTATDFLGIPKGTTAQRPANPDYGAMRYNTTTGFAEVYTSAGWTVMGAAPPTITTVTPGTYNGESGTSFTINGTGFTSDAAVKFVDTNNTEFTAALVTFVNSTQLLATTPQDFTVAQEPLDVKVIQLSGIVTKLDCIDCGGTPSWTTTAGQIGGTIYRNGSVSTSVAATDPDSGATITYSVNSGALPSGLTLNTSTGAITGTAPNVGSDTTYNFTLRATDNAGNTADRAFSMVVLQGSPAAPTIGTATRSATQSVQVTFTAPANAGGNLITSYTATSNPGNITASSASSPITVTGLTNGTSYTFTVTATNSYGTSVASSASNSAIPYGVPSAPTIGTATQTGQTTATVTFTAPFNGGSTITSYVAVASPGGATGSINQAGSGTITVSGLTAATNYTFTVYAVNAAGNSLNSAASNQITTAQPPAPTSVEYLVVAGGGGGGNGTGAGGGAGGYQNSTLSVSASTGYTVSVGGGGSGGVWGGYGRGSNGSNSQFASITSIGGGGGGGGHTVGDGSVTAGLSGGSGGGGAAFYGSGPGGAGTSGQGNNGGNGEDWPPYVAGGGGGAGGAGSNGHATTYGGPGGSGSATSITGTSIYYAGGGGGGGGNYQDSGTTSGGAGGGGNGAAWSATAGLGGTNLGGGGGGQGGGDNFGGRSAGAGGSGVVIIAYPDSFRALTSISGLSYDQPSRSGYRVYRFTGGTGTISW
jgi:hypothetical protein